MTLAEFVEVVRRRAWAFALCVLAGVIGALAFTAVADREFRATSRVIVNIPATSDVNEALAGAQLSRSLLETYAVVATSRQVVERARTEAGVSSGSLEAVAQTNTYLIDISATTPSPSEAAALANATASVLTAEVERLEAGRTDPVRVSTLEQAQPPRDPISPVPLRDLLVGLALGLLGGAALVALMEGLDRSLKGGGQAAGLLGVPLLGSVPRTPGLAVRTMVDPRSTLMESLRAIRTALRFLSPDERTSVLLVTSPNEGEGKTTVATSLAISFAQGGESVLLVDADMRRAALTELAGLERSVGLASVIVGRCTLDDALRSWQSGVTVLPAGATPPNAAELCGSQALATLVEDLAQRFDVVVIDAPPVLPVTDPVVLSPQVDGVLLVTRQERTSRTSAVEAARRLRAVGSRLLGVVHNDVRGGVEYYSEPYYGGRAPLEAAGASSSGAAEQG